MASPLFASPFAWADERDAESEEESQPAGEELPADVARGEEFETDPARLRARQKQIDIGKATPGYQAYLAAVPKHLRRRKGKGADPATPDVTAKLAKRRWDGMVKAWRAHLHAYDDPAAAAAAAEHHSQSVAGKPCNSSGKPLLPAQPRLQQTWQAEPRHDQHGRSEWASRHPARHEGGSWDASRPGKEHTPHHQQQRQQQEKQQQQQRHGSRTASRRYWRQEPSKPATEMGSCGALLAGAAADAGAEARPARKRMTPAKRAPAFEVDTRPAKFS